MSISRPNHWLWVLEQLLDEYVGEDLQRCHGVTHLVRFRENANWGLRSGDENCWEETGQKVEKQNDDAGFGKLCPPA